MLLALVGLWVFQTSEASSIADLPISSIPIVVIDTHGNRIRPKYEGGGNVEAWMEVWYPVPEATSMDGPADESWWCEVKEHGQSTASLFPKKGYGIDTEVVPVFGFPPHFKWIVKAPYADMSLIRDVLAFNLSNAIGMYASRTRLFEMYLVDDGHSLDFNEHYRGVYVFEEKIAKDPYRVDIATNVQGTDPLVGGYIGKVDKSDAGDIVINLDHAGELLQLYPRDGWVGPQEEYWGGLTRGFEQALFSRDRWLDESGGYKEFVELETFVDYWLISELYRSCDAYRVSTYIHKADNASAIRAGPPWDYNLALGKSGTEADPDLTSQTPEGWQYEHTHKKGVGTWYAKIAGDAEFKTMAIARYRNYRQSVWTNETLAGTINAYEQLLQGPASRNFEKWDTLGHSVWPFPPKPLPQTYAEEIDLLRNFVLQRVAWMDENLKEDVYLYHEGVGVGSTCDIDNMCGGAQVQYTGTEPLSTDCDHAWQSFEYPQCAPNYDQLANNWRGDADYATSSLWATSKLTADGSSCSIQMYLWKRDRSCPAPVYCNSMVCTPVGWEAPPPTHAPTVPPTPAPTEPPTRSPTKPPVAPSISSPAPTPVPTLPSSSPQPTLSPTSIPSQETLSPSAPPSHATTAPSPLPTAAAARAKGFFTPATSAAVFGGVALVVIVVALVICCRKQKPSHYGVLPERPLVQ